MTGLGSLATTGQVASSSSSSEGSTSLAGEGDFSLNGLGSLATIALSWLGREISHARAWAPSLQLLGNPNHYFLTDRCWGLFFDWAGLLGQYRQDSLAHLRGLNLLGRGGRLLFDWAGLFAYLVLGWGGRFLSFGAGHLLYNCLGNLLYYFLTGRCWGLFFDWAEATTGQVASSSSSSEGSTSLAGEGDFSLTGLGSLATIACLGWGGRFLTLGPGHLLYNCLGNPNYYFLTDWSLATTGQATSSSSSSEGSTSLAGEGDFSLTGLGSSSTASSSFSHWAGHLLYNCLGNLLYYFLTGWCWGSL